MNLYQTINRVRNCIEAGVTVILIDLEDLHEALYDVLNQRYTRIGRRLYCRIAMVKLAQNFIFITLVSSVLNDYSCPESYFRETIVHIYSLPII